jgi:hypothetical protein
MTTALLTKVYRVPLFLSFVTTVGLLSALLGDGVWDAFSWVLLAIPITVIAWKFTSG